MNYDEFVSRDIQYYQSMVRLIDTKIKYGMEFTDEELTIKDLILQVEENNKINQLRDKYENLLLKDEYDHWDSE